MHSRIESGHFTGFFRNAPFGKPGILRGFQGFGGSHFMTPRSTWRRGNLVIIRGVNRWGLAGDGQEPDNGIPDRPGIFLLQFFTSPDFL